MGTWPSALVSEIHAWISSAQKRSLILDFYAMLPSQLPHTVLCSLNTRLTVFFSACLRVKDCVSPSLYTCHLLNLMTQILRIHLTMMTMTMTTRTRLRRTSQTGHQWVHLSAHCLQSLLSPLFLSVNGAKHIRAKVKVSMRPKCPILLELIGW